MDALRRKMVRAAIVCALAACSGLGAPAEALAAPRAKTSRPRPDAARDAAKARPAPDPEPALDPPAAALRAEPGAGIAKAKVTGPDPEPPSDPTRAAPPTAAPLDRPAPADEDGRPAAEPRPAARAIGAPRSEDEASPRGGDLEVHPYFLVSGGVKADFVKERPNETKNDRVSTFAMGRIGVKARWLDLLSAESEFMASGGIGLHGTSAYEGQAAMQVRQQVIRLTKYGLRLEVGRLIDEASVDYFSAHITETFIQDTATRDPLLFTGFNLGNGLRGTYELFPFLRVGINFNAGNPVSNTASLLVGGPYPPFDRFYIQPYQQVNQSANNFPDDNFHEMVLTPSVLLDTPVVDARLAVQMFDINTNMSSETDEHIRGYNLRGTVRAKLFERVVVPFFSSAYTRNDTLVPTNLALRARDRYHAVNLGGGIDLNLRRRFQCSHDCADGLGAQYQQVQFQIGDGLVTTQRYLNIGSTFWIAPNVSASLRFAMWMQEAEQPVTAAGVAAGQTRPDVHTNGERSILGSLRFIMP